MKKLITVIFIFTISTTLFSQQLGLSFMFGYPQGDFRSNVDRMGFGGQLHGTFWTPTHEMPYTIGLDLGYLVYGQVDERKPWVGFPGVYLNLSRTNSLANFHILMEVSPFFGTIRPYLEGLFGGSYIFTQTSVNADYEDEDIASTTNYDDFTWNYGGGVGILFKIAGEMENVDAIYFDFKSRYLFGTEAEYLTENSFLGIDLNGNPIFKKEKSKTDFLSFHLGIIVNMNILQKE
ncbi:MAG: hypothetical protein HYS24_13595 [Ignavibacteriales bacterium]|nr:hypothetical protein [Ignavibacteriales bacterium]MBK7981471.1 hypothetical protein [Ignavibacteriota bacterium]